MNINKQYAWQSGANSSRENNPLLSRNLRGLVSGKEWIWEYNNHLQPPAITQLIGLQSRVCFWKGSPPAGVNVLQKGFKAGLSKQQISNVFANQEALNVANISPLTAIDTFSVYAMER